MYLRRSVRRPYRGGLAGTDRSTKGEAGTVERPQKGSKPGEATWDDWARAKSLTPDRVTL